MVAECHFRRFLGLCATAAMTSAAVHESDAAEGPFARLFRVRLASSMRDWPEKWTPAPARKPACAKLLPASLSATQRIQTYFGQEQAQESRRRGIPRRPVSSDQSSSWIAE